jgi:hypothetical protein
MEDCDGISPGEAARVVTLSSPIQSRNDPHAITPAPFEAIEES